MATRTAALRSHWHLARARLQDGEGLLGRFARGAQWNTVAVGFTVAASFLGNILFARILGQESFGAYGIVQSTLMTAVALASQFGGGAVNRYVSQLRNRDRLRTGRIIGLNLIATLVLSLVLAIALAASSTHIATDLIKAPALSPAIMVAAVIIPFMTLNGVNLGALAGFEAFPACAGIAALGFVAYLSAGALGAALFGIPGALLGGVFGYGAQMLCSSHVLKRVAARNGVTIRYRELRQEAGSLLRFNLPALLGAITPMTALWVGQVLLVRQANGFSDMALYSASYTLRSGVVLLPYVLYAVTVSMFNSYQAAGDRDRLRRLFWLNIGVTVGLATFVATACALTAPWILAAFGRDFSAGETILIILLAGAIFEATVAALYQVVQANELLWQSLFFVTLPRDLAIAGLAVWLVPGYGARGLAAAYVGGWSIALVATIIIVARAGITTVHDPHVASVAT